MLYKKIGVALLLPVLFITTHAVPVILKNNEVEIMISPEAGGCVKSFKDLKTKTEYADTHGVCVEIFPDKAYPGLLREQNYTVKSVSNDSAELAVKVKDAFTNTDIEIDKKYLLKGKTLSVYLTFLNTAEHTQTVTCRIQNIFSGKDLIITFPIKDGVQAIDTTSDNIPERTATIAGNWVSVVSPQNNNGVLMQFGAGRVEKVYNWYSSKQTGQEIYFKEFSLKKGESGTLAYTLDSLREALPTVTVLDNMAIGLNPPKLDTGFNYNLSVIPLTAEPVKYLEIAGFSGNVVYREKVQKAGQTELVWTNIQIGKIEISSQAEKCCISNCIYNDVLKKPPVPDFSQIKIPKFFPHGDYFWGREDLSHFIPPEENSFRRLLYHYRHAYMNTTTGAGLAFPPKRITQFKETGKIMTGELLREYNFRAIGGIELVHFRPKDVVYRTEEDVHKDLLRRNYDPNTLRDIYKEYEDRIILHNISDEPKPAWLNDTVMAMKYYQKNIIDSSMPISPIFNLQTEVYIPYVPIFYGDIYGVHHTGADIFNIGSSISGTVKKAGPQKPVWVMLQAFGTIKGEDSDWKLPSGEQMRLMLWSAVANGAKGIVYHANPGSASWRKGTYSDPAINSFWFYTPAWQAMSEIGCKIVSMGQMLIEADFYDSFPLESRFIGNDEFAPYRGKAVQLALLKLRDGSGYLLFALNFNLEQTEKAILKMNEKDDKAKVLLDIFADNAKLEAGKIETEFSVFPGEAKVWFFGSKTGAEMVLNTVRCGRAEAEWEILRLKSKALAVNNINAEAFNKVLDHLNEAIVQKKGSEATRLCKQAYAEYEHTLNAAPDYKAVSLKATAVREVLQRVSDIFRVYATEIFDMKAKVSSRQLRVAKEPSMNSLIKRMDDASLKLIKVEDKLFFEGNASAESATLDALLIEAKQLEEEMKKATAFFNQGV